MPTPRGRITPARDRRSAEGAGRAILRMANDARVDVELRTYVQIEKYIAGPKTDAATPSLKRILLDRKDENRERKARILAQLSDLLSRGDFYALGQKLTLKPLGPSVLLGAWAADGKTPTSFRGATALN